MNRTLFLLSLLICAGCIPIENDRGNPLPSAFDDYDIIWQSQSKNTSESMPLGGGDVGVNVWVEKNELFFYLSQSGTFDENNQMLKQGRLRIRLDPNPFAEADSFEQKLNLKEGFVSIKAVHEGLSVSIEAWVDVFRPTIQIEIESNNPLSVQAQYESWRTQEVEVPLGMRHSSFSLTGFPGKVITYADEVRFEGDSVFWYHRNREDKLLFDFMVAQQGLNSVKDQLTNTQKGLTFGGMLVGDGMVRAGVDTGTYVNTAFKAWKIKSREPKQNHALSVYLHTEQTETLADWRRQLSKSIRSTNPDHSAAKAATRLWWRQFWERSYIITTPDGAMGQDSLWQIGRNYQLFRYMLGCNAYGKYPSKFNGSLFTFDPVFINNGKYDWTPDFRQWGGGSFTAQNQRMVYWPMLKSGDAEMMIPQFDLYKNALSAAEARTSVYWGHGGCSFTEQLENFGLPFAGGWGFDSGPRKRDPDTEWGVQTNPYVNFHYVNQLEFALMILDYAQFSGDDISEYVPFIKSALQFFDEHYQYRNQKRSGQPLDEEGKLVLYPSTAAETYKWAKNPTDVIAALRTVVKRMIDLPERYVSLNEKEYYAGYMLRIPEIPTDIKQGHRVIKPAASWKEVSNVEIPELYPIFPYAIYGMGKPDLEIARNTWYYGESNKNRSIVQSWSQVGVFAARLGLTREAADFVSYKLSSGPWRFPAFWGPGFDWVPDVNHGGSGMIALQEMLLQTDGTEIYLLPAWPADWDVRFKLHAPGQTTIEADYQAGRFKQLVVTPSSRKKDIHMVRKGKTVLLEKYLVETAK